MLNYELSIDIGERINAVVRLCYENAARALIELSYDQTYRGVLYVEGYASISLNDNPSIPLDHAWLQTVDGVTIDPTLWAYENDGRKMTKAFYFPVVWFDNDGFTKAYDKRGFLPLVPDGQQHRFILRKAYKELGLLQEDTNKG